MAYLNRPGKLPHKQLADLVERIQSILWCDNDDNVDADKEWDSETLELVAGSMSAAGLGPQDDPPLNTSADPQVVLDRTYVKVPLRFDGVAKICLPAALSEIDQQILAERTALARVVATFENPDAPEEAAFEEYVNECSEEAKQTAERDWLNSEGQGLSGDWSIPPTLESIIRED